MPYAIKWRIATMWVTLGVLSLKVRSHARHAISRVVKAFSFFGGVRSAQILGKSCTYWT